MELNYKEYGAGHPLVILHGLFGMGDNWSTLARQFGEDYLTLTPDLRNHGRSPHLPEMDYPSMAADVKSFLENNWLYNSYLMGHSMGGKVAMQVALDYGDLVDKLIVVDIAPKQYHPGHDEIFEAMLDLKLHTMQDRKEVQRALLKKIPDNSIVQFILKNIVYDKTIEQYIWRMNLDTIHNHYSSILAKIQSDRTFDKPTLFISGAQSPYIKDDDKSEILKYFPDTQFKVIDNAGHWVHADQPQQLYDIVIEFLNA